MPNGSDGILEYEPGDLTCIVEADLQLSDLQRTLRAHGQRLSLDPPSDPTLGDCLLRDLSGPLSHRFGTMRDLVIGVTVRLPDGTRANSGGKVVKNVAGYDLGKLFCGSGGRFGAVERLALRLHPLPPASRSVTTDISWLELHRSQLVASAVDLVDGRLHVLFEGARRAVDTQALAVAGRDFDGWDEIRKLQASLPGRIRWSGGRAPLVRPGRQLAYVAEPQARDWSPLAERVREALCSRT